MVRSCSVTRNNDARDPGKIESVDRALTLLTLLVEHQSLSVSDAAAELGVAPSTAHRLLSTMAARGFATQSADRHYWPGPAILAADSAARSIPALRVRLRPVLQNLFAQVSETVHLQVLLGTDSQFADGIEATRPTLRVGLRIGTRIPAYCTSGGKALLAQLPEKHVETLHASGLPPWPQQRIHSVQELSVLLAATRERGYAINHEESEVGVIALGAAITGIDGHPIAALAIAVPSPRFDPAREPLLVRYLLAARDSAQKLLNEH